MKQKQENAVDKLGHIAEQLALLLVAHVDEINRLENNKNYDKKTQKGK